MKRTLLIIIIICIFYFYAFTYSSYWDSSYDMFEQPLILQVLTIPMVIVFFYFIIAKTFVNKDEFGNAEESSIWHQIFVAAFGSFCFVGLSFVLTFMIPIILALIYMPIGMFLTPEMYD